MTSLIRTCVEKYSVQPGVEPLGIAEAGQVAPGMDKRLLHGILRGMDVTEDQPSDRKESVTRGTCERLEGVVIATLCRLDLCSSHRRILVRDRPGRVRTLRRMRRAEGSRIG
jgi:hypothetical protein